MMLPDNWGRVREILADALECEPGQRRAVVEAACGGDDCLKAQISDLLSSYEAADAMLQSGAFALTHGQAIPSVEASAQHFKHLLEGTDRFVLQRCLGSGSFGIVWEAYDRDRKTVVALKTLHLADPAALFHLKSEFRTLVSVVHYNLVNLYELMSDGQLWFFTMELVKGVSFLDHIRQGTSRRQQLARLRTGLRQLAEGICALHDARILHRDIKPANVLVTPEGRVVLLDFGLATELGPQWISQSLRPVGTPLYMSPEQAAGSAVSEASDWYSVGVMLFEALTGSPPLFGTMLEVLQAKQQLEPPRARELVAEVPEDLDTLCQELLRRSPAERPQGKAVLDRLARPGESGKQTASAVLSTSEFVGRKGQLDELHRAFDAVKQGRAVTVHIHGGSGMGKTALAHRFLDELGEDETDVVILAGRCYEHESVPFKAVDGVVDALSRYLRRFSSVEAQVFLPRDVQALARLFPVLLRVEAVASARRKVLEIPDPHELRRRAFGALRELLGRLADRKHLVILIDDLQWGDEDSAPLLAELMRPPDPPVLLLVACYRSEESATSPLLTQLLSMGRSAGWASEVREVMVSKLSHEEACVLAISLLGEVGEGQPEAAARAVTISRESGGIPFFVTEMARYGLADGTRTLDELIRRRVSSLPDQARRLLEVVAIAGEPVKDSVAFEAAQLESHELESLSVLRGFHLVRVRGTEKEVEPYHDRIRETVVAQLSRPVLQRQHYKLAMALESSDRGDAERLAMHFQAAQLPEKAGHYASVAASRAAEALAFDRAARLYQLAVELRAPEGHERKDLLVKLGDALSNAGRGAEAARAFLAATTDATGFDSIDLRRRAAQSLLCSGCIDEGMAVFREVVETVGMRLPKYSWGVFLSLLLHRAHLRLRGLRFRERDMSQASSGELARIDTCLSAVAGLTLVDPIKAAGFGSKALLGALKSGDVYRIAMALSVEASMSSATGVRNHKRTARLNYQAMALAQRTGNAYALGFATLAGGLSALCEGRWQDGRRLNEEAFEVFQQQCTGVTTELLKAQFFSLFCLYWLGELGEFSRRLPAVLDHARNRGDLFADTHMRTWFLPVSLLAADQPEQAKLEAEKAAQQWSQRSFQLQHFMAVGSVVQADLYCGSGRACWDFLGERWPTIRRSLHMHLKGLSIWMLSIRAAAALAAASHEGEPKRRRALLNSAGRMARHMGREKNPYSRGLADLTYAGAAAGRGDHRRAVALLEAAQISFQCADMALLAAVASRRHGQLIGGPGGTAAVQAADHWMRTQQIKHPAKFSDMFAPGNWEAPIHSCEHRFKGQTVVDGDSNDHAEGPGRQR